MSQPYVPERGDVIWLSFDPQAGREQAGRRPALVLSPAKYNSKAGLLVVCPITSRVKNYPFEVSLPKGLAVTGVVLADQVKSVDWQVRRAEFACKSPSNIIVEVLTRLEVLLA